MPYRSESRRKKFHALLGEGKIKKETVAEYDQASKGLRLPDKVGKRSGKVTSIKQIKKIRDRM